MASKLISTKQLYEALQKRSKFYILDVTYVVPDLTPLEYHYKHRIPSSQFLDMKAISDSSSGLTMTMPGQEQFIEHMKRLKVKKDTTPVVLYDLMNMTSPRAWFMFKVFGRDNVVVLDGGLHKWMADKLPIDSGKYEISKEKDLEQGYEYVKNQKLIRNYHEIMQISKDQTEQVVDARPAKAFNDAKIPNSKNVPFDILYNEDKTFKKPEELRKIYEKAGVDFSKNVINSCRIGHSASVNIFAMALAGKESHLYDGSWEEWSKKAASA